MSSFKRALLGLGLAGIVFGLIDLTLIVTSDRADLPALFGPVGLVIGWAFIGTGLYAWLRRPSNRIGAMMTWVGFAWFLGPLALSDIPAVFIVGVIFNNLAIAGLLHLMLLFPSGRLESLAARRVVVSGYIVASAIQALAVLTLRDPTELGDCDGCPMNPIALVNDKDLFEVIVTIQSALGALVIGAAVYLIVRRRRALGPSARAALAPVYVTGIASTGALCLTLVTDLAGLPDDAVHTVNWVGIVIFATIPFAFLIGLLRSRFSRAGAVGELISNLSESQRGDADIRSLVADALGDPTLEFAYWLPEQQRYVDANGETVELPGNGGGRGCTQVELDGDLIAALVYDRALDEDAELIRATGAAAALALRNERLEAELRAKVTELRASRSRIVEAADAERQRLERNLHDGAQQHLVSLALNLRMARGQIEKHPAAAAELLEAALADVTEATDELRELARGIHPAVLSDRGLEAAIGALANRSTVPVVIESVPSERLPAPVEAAAYYVVAESLTNATRYAQASEVTVRITFENEMAFVTVADDGIGGADLGGGTGLRGLADRVAALDGRLQFESPPGEGTTVVAVIPCV